MRKIIRIEAAALVAMVAISLAVTACNTVEGAGKDVQQAGQNMQDLAERNK